MSNPTLLGTGGHSTGDNTPYSGKYYANVGLGRSAMKGDAITTESYVSQTIRTDGTISYLSWGVDHDFGTTLTFALSKGSSISSLAISIGASQTGIVTDGTHNVSVSSGDNLDFVADAGTGTYYSDHSFYCASARFDAGTATAQMLATVGQSTLSPTISQQFVNFLGILGGGDATESEQQTLCLAAGTWQYMACYLDSNGFNRTMSLHNRINGSNGSMGISIPTSTTGGFEDTTHSDSVNSGDLLNYGFLGTSIPGSGSIEMIWIGAHFLPTNSSLCMIGGTPNLGLIFNNIEAPNVYYSSIFGGGNITGGTTTRSTGLVPYALTASTFTNHIIAADQLNAATFSLLKNGTASTLATSSGNGDTGYFITGSGDSVEFEVGDTCGNQVQGTGQAGNEVIWDGAGLLLSASA